MALLTVGMLVSTAAVAQELEEIVVTARKVKETLADAPVSAVVTTGEKLTEAGVSRVEELVNYVPNFAMSETGIGTNLYVRGIGSGINQAFEQSVGLYIDGIYYGRAQLTRVPFMDLAQAEALRGPQAILLGNNSIAGALNLITNKPSDRTEASVSALYVPQDSEKEINVVLNGALIGGINGRFAGRYRGTNGYVKNDLLGRDEPRRDELAGRLSFGWSNDLVDATVKFELDRFNVTGRQIEIIKALPATTRGSSPTGFSNNSGSQGLWVPNLTYLQYLGKQYTDAGNVASYFDSNPAMQEGSPLLQDGNTDYHRTSNGDSSNNHVDTETFNLVFHLSDWDLTSLFGHVGYGYNEDCDCDFTGVHMFNVMESEGYEQWSEELRISSPQTQRVRLLAGLYYQADKLAFREQFFLPSDAGVVKLVGLATQGLWDGAVPTLGDTSIFRDYDQHSYVSSAFGQVSADLTDRWKASLGLRYSHIEKEASRILREGTLDRQPYNINDAEDYAKLAAGAVAYASIFKVAFHELAGSRKSDKVAFELVSDFKITPDILVYGSVKNGFKSGGFDARSNSDPVPGSTGAGTLYPAFLEPQVNSLVPAGSFEYEDEKALAFELGSKLKLLNDTAEVSLALFHTNFDNLQVSIFDGTLGFNVGNAASAYSEGFELDGRWAVTDHWTLNGSLSYLHFRFKDFPNGQCTQGQLPDYPTYPDDPSRKYEGKCDYSGKTNQYVSPWSGNVGIAYRRGIGSSLEFRSNVDILFKDSYLPTQNLDERVRQDAYCQLDLRLALGADDGTWEVAFLGRNLNNATVVSYANDTPLAYSQFGSPTWYGFVDRDRNFAVQALYRYRP